MDTFSYVANDGTKDSSVATVTIHITPVNTAPNFDLGPDQTVAEDAPAKKVANFVRNVSPGGLGESGQTVSLEVTQDSNSALFSAEPSIDAKGTLTYTPAKNANGTATISVVAHDNGGTPMAAWTLRTPRRS